MSSRREMKRVSIMPSAVDRKSSEDWLLIMSDVLIWPLSSSLLTCSFKSHPFFFWCHSASATFPHLFVSSCRRPSSRPHLFSGSQQSMAAGPEVLCRSLFVKGR